MPPPRAAVQPAVESLPARAQQQSGSGLCVLVCHTYQQADSYPPPTRTTTTSGRCPYHHHPPLTVPVAVASRTLYLQASPAGCHFFPASPAVNRRSRSYIAPHRRCPSYTNTTARFYHLNPANTNTNYRTLVSWAVTCSIYYHYNLNLPAPLLQVLITQDTPPLLQHPPATRTAANTTGGISS